MRGFSSTGSTLRASAAASIYGGCSFDDLSPAIPRPLPFAPKRDFSLIVFSDAALGIHRSRYGVIVIFAGACVLSISRLQPSQAADGVAAEAFGVSTRIAGGVALMASALAAALGVPQDPVIFTDNDAVARMAFDEMSVKRALHIMRRLAWLQERVAAEDFSVEHLPGKYMVADMNTKVPDVASFQLFISFLYGSPTVVG